MPISTPAAVLASLTVLGISTPTPAAAPARELLTDLGRGDYAVGWFTLALLNAGLAQSKQRSGLAWWLVSLLLGPFATLLLVVLEPASPRRR